MDDSVQLQNAAPPPEAHPAGGPVILFDGVCNLCNAFAQWVIRHDRAHRIRFASLQSDFARRALATAAPGQTLPDSVVLLSGGRAVTRSDAAIGIARLLGPPFSLAVLALVLPRPIRDAIYSWIARNRYRWFGRQNACMVPTPALRARFLDASEPRRSPEPVNPADQPAPDAPSRARPALHAALAATFQRVGIAYGVLYVLPFPLGVLPIGLEWAAAYEDAKQTAIARLSSAVGGPELTIFPAGSGDTTYNYVELLVYALAAIALGLLWSGLARFRPVHLRVRDLFTVMLRFYLGATLISYGWVKVFPLQMTPLGPHNALASYADSSPMGLLWRFIGASPAYEAFAGLAEVIGGTLLFWRRTTPLGAVICAGVLLNVVLLNFCYDVPVKIFSSHLLLCSIVLVWPHMARLLSVLVLNLPAQPAVLRPLAYRRRAVRWTMLLVKFAFVGVALVATGVESYLERREIERAFARPSLLGVYRVESFVRDGVEGRASDDDCRWVRFGFSGFDGPSEFLTIQHADTSILRVRTDVDMDAGTIIATGRPDIGRDEPPPTGAMTFTRPEPDLLRIEGTLDGHTLVVVGRKQKDQGLLMSRGFRWITERSFNR